MSWDSARFLSSLTRLSQATVTAYERDVNAFIEFASRLDVRAPDGVDRQLIRRYLASMQTRGLARSTAARRLSALRRYFAWARRQGLISVDPTATLSASGADQRLPRVLRDEEIRTLLDEPTPGAATDSPFAERDTAVVEVLYGSGLRVGELCGLDLDLSLIHI